MRRDMPFGIVDACRENKVCLKSVKIGATVTRMAARKIMPLILFIDCVGSIDSHEK